MYKDFDMNLLNISNSTNDYFNNIDDLQVEEPTELEEDIDFSDCRIVLLSQKDGGSRDI